MIEKKTITGEAAAAGSEADDKYLTGLFTSNARGFGFVTVEGYDQDFFIPEQYRMSAFHHDTVRIEPVEDSMSGMSGKDDRGRTVAKVVDIVSHEITTLVGTFDRSENFGFVVPDDRHVSHDIYIPMGKTLNAVDGHKVVCRILDYGSVNRKPTGEITEILGHNDDPGVDILSVVRSNDIPDEFPDEVMAEVNEAPAKVYYKDRRGRLDLRDELIVTVDGEESKDLDDAVSLHKEGDKYILGVHIADVSNYVKEDTAIDREALKRSTSVYLLNSVIPMLPHALCNGICSLNEGVDRLTLSCIMTIDKKGNIIDRQIAESVINSTHRMTYTSVNKILEDHDQAEMEKYADAVPLFQLMQELSHILRDKRKKRGALDFDFAETVIELDEKGRPVDIHPYYRGEAQRIIEDFMLAANETVARFAFDNELPFLYRVHGFPDADKLENLSRVAAGFGHTFEGNFRQIHPKKVQELLESVKGEPEEDLIDTLTLRSMQRAQYDTSCDGHFGLAAGYYCHFTSPIRRYPDLQIHRILKEFLKKKLSKNRRKHYEKILPDIADRTSALERRADDAEREVEKIKKVEYMIPRIGEEFEGRISGLTGWGMFVELPETTIEGMIPVRTLTDDFYDFDEESYELIGKANNKHYKLSMPVTIRVVAADKMTRQIDFILVDDHMGGGLKNHPEDDTLEKRSRKDKKSGSDKKAKNRTDKDSRTNKSYGSDNGKSSDSSDKHSAGSRLSQKNSHLSRKAQKALEKLSRKNKRKKKNRKR